MVYTIYIIEYKENKSILILGENIDLNINNYYIQKYLYDNITYKELIKIIIKDEQIIIKGKESSLNQLLNNYEIIVLNVNNKEYQKKCRTNSLSNKYINNINKNKSELLYYLKRITNSKIIIIDNSCDNDRLYNVKKDKIT